MIRALLLDFLVFTKSVDSNFRTFWLALLLGICLAIHCFWTGVEMEFRLANVSENEILIPSKYQESNEVWFDDVYWY